ncbi:helix-turn-helix domain-containing protein [Geodermatophilus sp. CPCC 205761]|uniref:helix-turn-helix domain-containing protein n=1 Tax=Geodermatophilus sp. CPCC 205761 TaxID=2936597 RepID=UPI003EEDA7FA
MSTEAEVQAAVDRLNALLGRSVLVEDVDQHPVWWCTRGPVDPTRLRTILHRRVDPGAAAIVKRFKLDRATSPVRTPAMPEVEMWSRWCVPLRHEGRFLGLMWILDRDESLAEEDLGPAIDCAELAAAVLAKTRQSAESIRFVRDELVARLLEGPDEEAVRELARLQQIPHDALVQIEAPARPGGWTLPDDMSLHVVSRGPRAATSGAPLPLIALREAVRRAAATRRAVLAGARPDPPTWDGLGAWRLIVDAPEDLTVEALHPGAAILAAQPRNDLLTTARLLVDVGGDVTTAAHELHVHRTTIYYRLERIKELTGVDMQDGLARTHLQLALWLVAYRAQP